MPDMQEVSANGVKGATRYGQLARSFRHSYDGRQRL
jgi:hypothetical protein